MIQKIQTDRITKIFELTLWVLKPTLAKKQKNKIK